MRFILAVAIVAAVRKICLARQAIHTLIACAAREHLMKNWPVVILEEIKEEDCEGSLGVCHAGLGCIYGQCEKCKTLYRNTCDEEIFGDVPRTVEKEDFLCCAQCPSDCDRSNDFPCEASYLTENTCHDPLPMCTREH